MNIIAAWILVLTWAVLSGWLLSLAGALNRTGYALAALPIIIWGFRHRRDTLTPLARNTGRHLRRFARVRAKRPLPAIFALTALAAAIGGLLYAPNNYDFLMYRFVRMLHWWNAEQWHWIHTVNFRQNVSGAGMEWAMMPLLVFLKSSRLFFLLNLISYLLMPGLVFSILTRLGIGRRTSWFWMWILPAGYCYTATAGGVSSDIFGAVLSLAAVHFGCLAARRNSLGALWLALLSAGLMTSIKTSNLPLLLPVLIAIRPALALLRTRVITTAVILCLAVAVSFAPSAILNHQYTEGWSGDPFNQHKLKASSPPIALLGNSLQLALGCLSPPILPQASAWTTLIQNWIPDPLRNRLANGFPRFELRFRELANEEHAGLGCGITLLLLTAIGTGFFTRRNKTPRPLRWSVLAGGIIAGMAFVGILAAQATARIISPYYPLLIAAALTLPGMEEATRKRWWRGLAVTASLAALLIVILTPSRPLWPAQTVANVLYSRNPDSRLTARISAVYSVYHHRADALAPLREILPSNARVIGFIHGGCDPEVSLWQPLGQRRVTDVIGADMTDRPKLDRQGIQAIVARRSIVEQACGSLENWMRSIHADLLAIVPLTLTVSEGEQAWCVVTLTPPPLSPPQSP